MSDILFKITVLIINHKFACHFEDCLLSVLGQELSGVEVIVMDAKDDIPKDMRGVKTVCMPGVSYGELINAGIKHAHSEYIAIIDADDYINGGTLRALYKTAQQYKSDIVRGCYGYYYSNLTSSSPLWNETMGGVWCEPAHKLAATNLVKSCNFGDDVYGKVLDPTGDGEADLWLVRDIMPRISGLYRRKFLVDNNILAPANDDACSCCIGFWIESALTAHKINVVNQQCWRFRQDDITQNSVAGTQLIPVFASIDEFVAEHRISGRKTIGSINTARLYCYLNRLYKLRGDEYFKLAKQIATEFTPIKDDLKLDWFCVDETSVNNLDEIINNPEMFLKRLEAKDNAKVSVILPYYNVDKYIERALNSIVKQTMRDIEIICVDDGSGDDSVLTVRKYWRKDPRITIIYQDNKGLAAARNAGLHNAHAPYVYFCDSDDYIMPNTCELLYNCSVDNDVDLVVGNVELVFNGCYNLMRDERLHFAPKYQGLCDMTDELFEMPVNVWNKLFKRDIINKYDIHFPEGLWYEDQYFTVSYMLFAKNVYFLNKTVYAYVHHNDSIMGQTRMYGKGNPKTLDHFRVTEWLFDDYVRKYDLLGKHKKLITDRLIGMYDLACNYAGIEHEHELKRMANEFICRFGSYIKRTDRNIITQLKNGFRCSQAKEGIKPSWRLLGVKSIVKRVLYALPECYKIYKILPTWRLLHSLQNRAESIESRFDVIERNMRR